MHVWKGSPGPFIVRREPLFDAELLRYFIRYTYQGSQAAIAGLELNLQQTGISYFITHDGPVYELQTDVPQIAPDEIPVDRYEISTVADTVDLYANESVFNDAYNWDNARGTGQRSFKDQVEDFIELKTAPTLDPGLYTTFDPVVDHIRGGVPGFQRDYLVLSRFRRIDQAYAQGATGQINLDATRIVYTTAQLALPANVAFVLPAAPAAVGPFATRFAWGWKLIHQKVEIIGQWIEQSHELQFAPHSILDNTAATTNLVW